METLFPVNHSILKINTYHSVLNTSVNETDSKSLVKEVTERSSND